MARSVIVKDVESPDILLDEQRFSFIARSRIFRQRSGACWSGCAIPTKISAGAKRSSMTTPKMFALSSVLERREMEVLSATTGREAIAILSHRDVSIVLMDIMMPEMDSYDDAGDTV